MKKTIYVFEDSGYENLLPLVYTMPVWDIQCGIRTLLEKTAALYRGAEVRLLCRDYLAETVRENTGLSVNDVKGGETCLLINGRAILNRTVPFLGAEEAGFCGDTLIYARVRAGRIKLNAGGLNPEPLSTLKKVKAKAHVINYFWDAVELLPEQITQDFGALAKKGKKNLHIGGKSNIKKGVVFDTDNGPVYIGNGVTVEPNAVIIGPASVAEGSIVRAGAVIRESSIGKHCRSGGEISRSIIHSYSNKQHGGYLGNSYIGRWVNIGAGTNNSDLKNNYGKIKVVLGGKIVNTGRLHVGILLADHNKCAIGTNFNCGTIAGVCSNILDKPIAPKFIKSFTWGESEVYGLEPAISTARIAMKRRGVTLLPAGERLLKHIFSLTRP